MLKIRTILLLLIAVTFFFNSFGFIFYFLLERENAKEEAFEKIAEMKTREMMELISVSISNIQSGKIIQRINKKEIRYRGKMFDIVKEEKLKDKIIFYCIHDEKEDKLEREYSNNIHKNLNQKSAANSQLNFNHQIQFVELRKNPAIQSPVHNTDFTIVKSNRYYFTDNNVLTPPPKLFFS